LFPPFLLTHLSPVDKLRLIYIDKCINNAKDYRQNMDVIRLKNITFYAHHGFYEAERELGQKFELDIEVRCDLLPAGTEDDLKKTIDYRAIYQIAKDTFENNKFKLIETVAQRMAQKILLISGIHDVLIRVRKPHVPLNGLLDYVEIEIFREK
jgi:7,8-dihydroneopterin aldolase/epimerase/oxygenase